MPNQYTHKQTQLLVRIHALCNPCNKALQFRVSAELQKNIPTDHTASSVCKDFFVSAKKYCHWHCNYMAILTRHYLASMTLYLRSFLCVLHKYGLPSNTNIFNLLLDLRTDLWFLSFCGMALQVQAPWQTRLCFTLACLFGICANLWSCNLKLISKLFLRHALIEMRPLELSFDTIFDSKKYYLVPCIMADQDVYLLSTKFRINLPPFDQR